jgi:hypothetical protein
MKKLQKITLGIAIGACLAITAIQASAAGYPSVITATLPGGTNNTVTVPYTQGVGQAVYTSFKPAVLEVVMAANVSDDKTVTVKRAAAGPVYHTTTITSNTASTVSFETNNWWILRGDQVVITSTSTNAGTVKITGTEQ